jgi:hypothetical protein
VWIGHESDYGSTTILVYDYSPEVFARPFESKPSPDGANFIVRLADLIPSRYGIMTEVVDYPRQPSDRVTFIPLDYEAVINCGVDCRGFATDLGDDVIGA